MAFIKASGLALIYPALEDAVERPGAHLGVLTSDYLDVTDPQALRRLMLLAERDAEVRVFQAERQSFHLKAYICTRSREGKTVWGAAFVGSSNLSRTALTDGLEWNLRVEPTDDADARDSRCFREFRAQYERLLAHPNVRRLDYDWIERYEERRRLVHSPRCRRWARRSIWSASRRTTSITWSSMGSSYRELAEFGRRARDGQLKLPPGCFVNYDLAIIDFLTRLQGKGPATDYQALRDSLNRCFVARATGNSMDGGKNPVRDRATVHRSPGAAHSRLVSAPARACAV